MVTLLLRSSEEVDARLEAMTHDARFSPAAVARLRVAIGRARHARAEPVRRVSEGIAMRVDQLSRRGMR